MTDTPVGPGREHRHHRDPHHHLVGHHRPIGARGWYFYDWANSAFSTTVVTVFLGPYLTAIAERPPAARRRRCDGQRRTRSASRSRPGSFFAYAVSLSVLLHGVRAARGRAPIADRSPRKKQLLAAVRLHRRRRHDRHVLPHRRPLPARRGPVPGRQHRLRRAASWSTTPSCRRSPRPTTATRSPPAAGRFGYLGGGLLLAAQPGRCAHAGRARPGHRRRRPLEHRLGRRVVGRVHHRSRCGGCATGRRRRRRAAAAIVLTDGFRQLAHTLRELRGYPLTLVFLVAYLIYNDGIQTVIALASAYGTEELGLASRRLIAADPDGAVPGVRRGAAARPARRAAYGAEDASWPASCCGRSSLVAAYFLPARQPLPFFALGAGIGLVLGGSQALSRSLFSHLIPRGKEARVLRPLRDQRPRHELARPAAVRPGLPAHRQLPGRDHLAGGLLRRRVRPARTGSAAAGDHAGRKCSPAASVTGAAVKSPRCAQLLPAQPHPGEGRDDRLDQHEVHELPVDDLLQRQQPQRRAAAPGRAGTRTPRPRAGAARTPPQAASVGTGVDGRAARRPGRRRSAARAAAARSGTGPCRAARRGRAGPPGRGRRRRGGASTSPAWCRSTSGSAGATAGCSDAGASVQARASLLVDDPPAGPDASPW